MNPFKTTSSRQKATSPLITLLLLASVLLAACSGSRENRLEAALEMAGDNRASLENVLRHFEGDSAGLAAAEFLIANMPMHLSYRDTIGLAPLNVAVDSCVATNREADCYALRDLLDPLLAPISSFSGHTLPDLQFIDDKSLINHIGTALKVWRESPWASHLDFDQFCEWILPYKVQELQPVDGWMDYLSPLFDSQLRNIGYCDIYSSSLPRACRMVNDCMRETIRPSVIEVSFSPDALSMKTRAGIPIGRCAHYVALATAVMRSKGIPVAIDYTPIWGYRNLGHEWNVLLDRDGSTIPFDALGSNPGDALKPDERMAKVFRRTFAPDPSVMDLLRSGAFVPSTFSSPFMKDVTSEYLPPLDFEVDLPHVDDPYVFLALSNRYGWTPVDFSKVSGRKARFNNVGAGNVYAVLRYTPSGNPEVIGDPFILNEDGSRNYFSPDETQRRSVRLYRKYPVLPHVLEASMRMVGGEFQVSDTPDFKSYRVVHTVTEPAGIVQEYVVPDSIPVGRFWRYRQDTPDTFCNIAEIEFLDSIGNGIPGTVIGTPGHFGSDSRLTREAAFDGDPLTVFDAPRGEGCWTGMDFGRSLRPTKITYLGRGDGNSIEKGDLYELSYFKEGSWVSLGRKTATGASIEFDDVPRNALLFLRDLTKGKEDRIFTYENGRQIWR